MTFQYRQYSTLPTPAFPDGILRRPEVPIQIRGDGGDIEVFALLDTGADETILPKAFADALQIKLDETSTSAVTGFSGGEASVVYGVAHFEIRRDAIAYRWSARVAFCDFRSPEDEIAILGHAGCLEFLKAEFDGELSAVRLQATPSASGIQTWAD